MSELYEKTGEWTACACMGSMYGEPYCPCVMAQRGLPKSEAHIAADQVAEKEATIFFGELFANRS